MGSTGLRMSTIDGSALDWGGLLQMEGTLNWGYLLWLRPYLIEAVHCSWGLFWLKVSIVDGEEYHHVPELSCFKLSTSTVLKDDYLISRCQQSWFLLGPLSLPVDDIVSTWDLTWLSFSVYPCSSLPSKDTGYSHALTSFPSERPSPPLLVHSETLGIRIHTMDITALTCEAAPFPFPHCELPAFPTSPPLKQATQVPLLLCSVSLAWDDALEVFLIIWTVCQA